MRTFVVSPLCLLFALLHPQGGFACEPCPACIRDTNAYEAVLPRNGQVRVRYYDRTGKAKVEDLARIHDSNNKPVPGSWKSEIGGWMVFTPEEFLKPKSRYSVVDRFGEDRFRMDCSHPKSVYRPFARFTTSDEILEVPTRPPKWPTSVRCVRKTCADSACCGPYDGFDVEFDEPPFADRGTLVLGTLLGSSSADRTQGEPFEVGRALRLYPSRLTCLPESPLSRLDKDQSARGKEIRVGFTFVDRAGHRTQGNTVLLIRKGELTCDAHLERRP